MPESLQFPSPLRNVAVLTAHGDEGAPSACDDPASAYERGRRDSEEKLAAQLLQQRAEFLELQTGVLKSLRECVPQVMRECEHELAILAIEVARKLVSGLPISAEMVEAAVRDALGQVEQAAEIHVSLHPDDLAMLQKAQSPLLEPTSGSPQVHVSSSPEVTRGGCLVQTRFGIVDARRETKLQLLKQAVQA